MKRCVQNLQKLADEMVKYAKANDGRLPPTEHWCDELISGGNVTEADFVCGESFWPGHFSYGMNANLDGASINDISPETVILFEICGDRNASGEAELAVYRHDVYGESFKTSNFLLGNFRVKSLTREQAERLKWEVNK